MKNGDEVLLYNTQLQFWAEATLVLSTITPVSMFLVNLYTISNYA